MPTPTDASGRSSMIFTLGGIVLILDQVTKALCREMLPLHARVPVIEGFLDLTHVRNRGMAFGLLNDINGAWVRWLLIVLAIAAVGIIWSYARHHQTRPMVALAFGGILGGAIGNLVDRIWLGHVVDFILAYWGDYQWPAFNVADTAITIGGVCLFLVLARDGDDLDDSEDDDHGAGEGSPPETPSPEANGHSGGGAEPV